MTYSKPGLVVVLDTIPLKPILGFGARCCDGVNSEIKIAGTC
jgi:hypothetical protein